MDEIAACPEIGKCLGEKFKKYLESVELEYAVEGFVQTEDNPAKRKKTILGRFMAIAAMADSPCGGAACLSEVGLSRIARP